MVTNLLLKIAEEKMEPMRREIFSILNMSSIGYLFVTQLEEILSPIHHLVVLLELASTLPADVQYNIICSVNQGEMKEDIKAITFDDLREMFFVFQSQKAKAHILNWMNLEKLISLFGQCKNEKSQYNFLIDIFPDPNKLNFSNFIDLFCFALSPKVQLEMLKKMDAQKIDIFISEATPEQRKKLHESSLSSEVLKQLTPLRNVTAYQPQFFSNSRQRAGNQEEPNIKNSAPTKKM
ncbi:MAG: hypothetical protein ACHQVK_02800 [Candidatus Paceibacterales bacterium]